ncbi:class A beta-lactamase [Phenylobacterium sp.]|uniref:class A beta-lactamase n=1 Tax=Phenylobacterium sp. TaxID=1871053 RepID=UPI00272F8EBB|nr:class A beta-lactamase [Phenylobacterium sp.]MDP1618001.1 class A beta-lactamase [Phenylobacterium sp.]MDP1987399.1 class A beta-lactamase [Phenylobacterium sp.]
MRRLVLLAAVLLVGACEPDMPQTVSTTPRLDAERLDATAAELTARAAPGRLGAAVMNLESGELWAVNGSDRFPMQSVFKAPLAAAVLAEVDAGRLDLNETITLTNEDISPPFSPVADAYPGRRDYTVAELLTLSAGASDNTAADVLMRRIGGPGAVTAWLRAHDIRDMRVDRYERQLQPEIAGLDSFRPAWKGESAYRAALQAVPAAQRQAAAAAYLSDLRDTTTPRESLLFLAKLVRGELLSEVSTARLLTIMSETTTGKGRLAAGLPSGARLAHKTGTARTDLGMNPATNDIGVVTLEDGRQYVIAVFLAGSTLPDDEREAIFADLARSVAEAVG